MSEGTNFKKKSYSLALARIKVSNNTPNPKHCDLTLTVPLE